ncbi:MAG: hypothetical protein DHS20C11_25670 [Lysobacteraceae bacterium]|nr:MAG: hypothetical protein DHS20C11_25670 [Xanthomonadaceae bacterium]
MELTFLNVFHVLLAIAMTGVILIQRGPGATAGAAFGGGASGTMFGSRGASSFLTRVTAFCATGFFLISMTMGVLASRTVSEVDSADDLGVIGQIEAPVEPASDVPAADVPAMNDSTVGDAEIPGIDAPSADDIPAADDASDATEDSASEEGAG